MAIADDDDRGGGGGIARGRALAARRRAAHITQAELAAVAQCSLPSVVAMEAGAIPRRSRVLGRIETALDGLEGAA